MMALPLATGDYDEVEMDDNTPLLRGTSPTRRGVKKVRFPPTLSSELGGGEESVQLAYNAMDTATSTLAQSESAGEAEEEGGARWEMLDNNIEGEDAVSKALKTSEKWVLRPYRLLIKLLGWTACLCDGNFWWVPMPLWILVITVTFVTQILTCYRRDRLPGESVEIDNTTTVLCGDHLISAYIIIDIILLGTYLFCAYLFSREDAEYHSRLANEVFVKAVQLRKGEEAMKSLISTLRWFLVGGALWIGASVILRVLTSISIGLFSPTTMIKWNTAYPFIITGPLKVFLVIISLIGFVFFDIVYIATVMNYAAQSEFIIYYLWAIRKLVKAKQYPSLDGAEADILKCRRYLGVLNGKAAAAAALVIFIAGSLVVVSIVTLNNDNEQAVYPGLAKAVRALGTLLYLALFSFPFIQAARVTHKCMRVKETSITIRGRPLPYLNTPQLDLDSYIHFTKAIRLRAALFGVPFYPWMAYAALTAFCFTALVLFQLGAYSFTQYL